MLGKISATTHVIFDLGQTLLDAIYGLEQVLTEYALSRGVQWKGKYFSITFNAGITKGVKGYLEHNCQVPAIFLAYDHHFTPPYTP